MEAANFPRPGKQRLDLQAFVKSSEILYGKSPDGISIAISYRGPRVRREDSTRLGLGQKNTKYRQLLQRREFCIYRQALI
jgi:hypothetical protein